ncbi:hypothetical protein [Actinoplanes sp. NPDC023714]|uniref:hypothetical protein n=1 Tax=Actinoplanes sp. NPDC023714 TaxID=3154322 RepID=UPI0033D20D4E
MAAVAARIAVAALLVAIGVTGCGTTEDPGGGGGTTGGGGATESQQWDFEPVTDELAFKLTAAQVEDVDECLSAAGPLHDSITCVDAAVSDGAAQVVDLSDCAELLCGILDPRADTFDGADLKVVDNRPKKKDICVRRELAVCAGVRVPEEAAAAVAGRTVIAPEEQTETPDPQQTETTEPQQTETAGPEESGTPPESSPPAEVETPDEAPS